MLAGKKEAQGVGNMIRKGALRNKNLRRRGLLRTRGGTKSPTAVSGTRQYSGKFLEAGVVGRGGGQK